MILTHSDQCVISTHALTEGDCNVGADTVQPDISTHALTEGDRSPTSAHSLPVLFQLTPSRRATYILGVDFFTLDISTHALTEGDYA